MRISLSALRPFLTLKLRFDQLNQLAEPHVQRFCDSPERIDVGIFAACDSCH